MIAPKRKLSKQRTNTRYANFKTAVPGIGECSQCHESKLSHRVCRHCGYYDGQPKLSVKQNKE